MYEIELKAHVYNKEETIKILNTFAKYVGFFQKQDTYYRLQKQNNNDFISVRIRKEQAKQEQNTFEKIYLTYKQKELKDTTDGTKIEVNNEKECELSNTETITSILLDTGFFRLCLRYRRHGNQGSARARNREEHLPSFRFLWF